MGSHELSAARPSDMAPAKPIAPLFPCLPPVPEAPSIDKGGPPGGRIPCLQSSSLLQQPSSLLPGFHRSLANIAVSLPSGPGSGQFPNQDLPAGPSRHTCWLASYSGSGTSSAYLLRRDHHPTTSKVPPLPQCHWTFLVHWTSGSLESHLDSLAGSPPRTHFLPELPLPVSAELALLPASPAALSGWHLGIAMHCQLWYISSQQYWHGKVWRPPCLHLDSPPFNPHTNFGQRI